MFPSVCCSFQCHFPPNSFSSQLQQFIPIRSFFPYFSLFYCTPQRQPGNILPQGTELHLYSIELFFQAAKGTEAARQHPLFRGFGVLVSWSHFSELSGSDNFNLFPFMSRRVAACCHIFILLFHHSYLFVSFLMIFLKNHFPILNCLC